MGPDWARALGPGGRPRGGGGQTVPGMVQPHDQPRKSRDPSRRAMSRSPTPRRDPWNEAIAHLCRGDPAMGALIERVGPCMLRPKPERDRFTMLVRSIVGQQISTK